MRKNLFCMQLVRWHQIRISNWFNHQINSPVSLQPPDHLALLEHIRNRDRSWEPLIPQSYVPTAGSAAPSPVPAPAAGGRGPSPGVPAAAPRSPAAPTSAPRGSAAATPRHRVNNTTYNPVYQQFRDHTMSLTAVRAHALAANDPVPVNDDGVETCLCYHVLGFCWSNCTRLADHQPQSLTEQQWTQAWCAAHHV